MEADRAYERRVLWLLAPTAVLVLYVETMVVPALPVIAHEFGTDLAATSWILTVYLLVGAASPPVLGRLGDIHGKKRVLLIVMAVYIASLVASAFAPTLGWLIATRTVQGIGFTMFPLAFGIVRDVYTPQRMAVAQGIISSMFGVGGAAGLFLGSGITQAFGWRSTYLSILPFAVLLWTAIALMIRPTGIRHPVRVDYAGAALLVAAILPLLYAIVRAGDWGLGDARTLVFVGAAVFFAALFLAFERTRRQPLVDARLLRHRDILITNVAGIGTGFGMFALFQVLPSLVQSPAPSGFGGSVVAAGLTQLPMSLTTLLTGPLNGRIVGRLGPRGPMAAGMALMALGYAWLWLARTSLISVACAMAVFGFAISLTMVATINMIVIATPGTHTGISSAMNQTFRLTGGSLGPAVAAYFLTAHTAPLEFQGRVQPIPTDHAFDLVFAVTGLVMLAAAVIALRLTGRRAGDPPVDVAD